MSAPPRMAQPWITWGATSVMALVGGTATYWALTPSPADRIRTAVPPLPDLSTAPQTLRTKLEHAVRHVQSNGTPAALAHYARLLQANALAPEAEYAWRLLLQVDPAHPAACYHLAHLRRTAGDLGETTLLLRRTVEHAPDYSPAWLLLGDMALKTGRFETAANCYQRRLALQPGDPYARLGLARLALQQADRPTGRSILLALVGDHPGFASAHNLLAQLYREDGNVPLADEYRWKGYKAGRFVAAPDPWMEALEELCFTPDRLFLLGMVHLQTGERARARELYEKAVALAPEVPDHHQLLGDVYRKLKEPELALASLQEAWRRWEHQGDPPSLATCIGLAAVQRELGQTEAAATTARRGLKSHPHSPELWVELGLARELRHDFPGAREAYDHALSLAPHDTAANFHLAEWWLRQGETAPALPHLRASLVQQPTFAPALRYLVEYHLGAHDLSTAQTYADTLLKAYHGDTEVRQLVSICYLRLGRALADTDAATALLHFQHAFDLNPRDVDIAYELGTRLLTAGRSAAAMPPLEALLALRPQDPSAHLFLAQACLMEGQPRRATALLEAGLTRAEAVGPPSTARNLRHMLEAVRR